LSTSVCVETPAVLLPFLNSFTYILVMTNLHACMHACIGALVMVAGESVLGENHTGIAAVIGIVGIGLIGTSGALWSFKPKKS